MRYLYLSSMLLVMLLCGCSTTYVPISWNYGDAVKKLSNTDTTLKILFSRYDPQRQTLRVRAASFEEVMMPYEVKYHLGAYRPDTRIMYRNLYHEYDEKELRDVMVHEFAHHVWFSYMNMDQRDKWKQHLALNPSPLQAMVRSIYNRPAEFDTEDFAFVLSHPRRIDIEKLASLNIINEQERDAMIKELPSERPIQPGKKGVAVTAGAGPAKGTTTSGTPGPAAKGGSVAAAVPDASGATAPSEKEASGSKDASVAASAPEKPAAPSSDPPPAAKAGFVAESAPDTERTAAPSDKAAPGPVATSESTPEKAAAPSGKAAPAAGSAVASDPAPDKTAAPPETPAPAPAGDRVVASEPARTPAPPVMDKGHN